MRIFEEAWEPCQTCTAGPDILQTLNCPTSYLIKTRHNIVGITNSPLHIIGVLFLQIDIGHKTTNQMVYISKNCRGFFLSQTAMKDLDVVPEDFPNHTHASAAISEHIKCSCPKRANSPTKPTSLPFTATQANLSNLKRWLLEKFESSAFNQCPHQSLPVMIGAPIKLHFKEGTTPYAVHTPIPVPHHWKAQVKEDLDRDVRLGIIEQVPQGTTTTWCARMVVTPKKNGSPRRTVDLQKLNNSTFRETHHTPSPFDLVSTVPTCTRKTVLDAWNGYHSLALDGSAKEATTFITEWGRYRYCRAPMGFHVSGDAYTRRFDDITIDEPRVVRCIDDSLLWNDTIENAFWHTFDYLKTCSDNGIVFNKEKFKFAEESIDFAGFEITKTGYKPLPKIIEAINNFPAPKNLTDMRSWFGLVNQLAYTFAQAPVMEPFRTLLSSKSFFWDSTMDEIFTKSKSAIVQLVKDGVRTFKTNRPTCLITDWSKSGIGFHLRQKHCQCSSTSRPDCGDNHWKLVFAGSRFTTDAESRYAPIEGEALAVVYGLQRCRIFVMGAPNLTVAVDHNPLVNIFNDREMCTISNPRILKLKEKTMMYRYNIIHVPGKSEIMKVSDITSRNPVKPMQREEQTIPEASIASYASQHAQGITATDWETVRTHAACDQECSSLTDTIINGFPKIKHELPPELRIYWPMRDDLYTIDSVPFKGKKMLIPKPLRPIVLEGLHAAHQGVSSMLANARERFFWPGLDAAVRLSRAQCRQCNEQAPSQHKEPPVETSPPETPFEQVAVDLCAISGFAYLIYVDVYSGWIEVANLTSKGSDAIRKTMLMYFATFGVPEQIASDGGPPFDSRDYTQFLKRWKIRRRLSSAYYPQSNGRAEVGVRTAKRILLGNIDSSTGKLDNDRAVTALLTHRNTPCQQTGISPATALFGRSIRDHLPLDDLKLRKEWQEIADKRDEALAKRHLIQQKTPPGRPRGPLPQLDVGDSVQLQNQHGNRPNKWNNTGFITEVLPHRQYRVVVDGSRRITLRNRRFLQKILPVCRQWEPAITSPTTADETTNSPPSTPTITHEREDTPTIPTTIVQTPSKVTLVPETMAPQPAHGAVPPRRGMRERRPPRPLSPKLFGPSHD